MTSYSPRSSNDVLSSTRINSGAGRMPTKPIVGHKRTGSGRIESKENLAVEGSTFSSPDLSVGSAGKSRPPYSPIARPTSRLRSDNHSVTSLDDLESPHESRIPRPTSTTTHNLGRPGAHWTPNSPAPSPNDSARRRRVPLGMKAAFNLAETQEARERSGSSSSTGSIDLKRAFQIANAEANRVALGSPSPAPRSYRRRESLDTRSNQYFGSPVAVDLGQRLQQFDRDHQLTHGNGPLDGLFTNKGFAASKGGESTTTLARKASDDSLDTPGLDKDRLPGRQPSHRPLAETTNWNAFKPSALLPPADFDPLPPVDIEDDEDMGSSPIARPTNPSPEKSYNWQFDADFTAGDLQISDSPRIRLDRNNSAVSNSPATASQQARRSNARLDRIRELEIEAANADITEEESSLAPKRSRLDEIRSREIMAVSPRAMAQSRLDEIRAKNAEARSRSSSPEELRDHKAPDSRATPPSPGLKNHTDHVAKLAQTDKPNSGISNLKDFKVHPTEEEKTGREQPSTRITDDSYDLLRRLAQATSSSPSPQTSPQRSDHLVPSELAPNEPLTEQEHVQSRLTRLDRQPQDSRAKSSGDRLTVGFAGLHKVSLSDSKRQSLMNTETDPIDRIEAEMKLFALMDNSEKSSTKGSTRAPSPGLSEKSEPISEETPKPKRRVDPLTLPTPRVTGAYVETPATIKAERDDEWVDVESDTPAVPRSARGKHISDFERQKIKQEEDSSSDANSMVASKPLSTRRAKKRPKRHPPLVNTATIPTVKDDLRAILREHHIDDSTLDNFDDLLDDQDIDAKELEKFVGETVMKIEEDMKAPGLTDHERELQAYDRMSKSLKTGLLGIRSAKQGIERLEDKVAHSEHKSMPDGLTAKIKVRTSSTSIPNNLPYTEHMAYIPLPRLYRRYPSFKLTPLGVLSLVLAIWYTIESVFCFLYVDTYECPRGLTCDWSPNEPYFPYAAPFMLDQWTSGGKGRALAWHLGDEVGDVVAEISDWVTGHDFTKDEVMYMNIWERKRHKRRLRKRNLHWKWVAPAQYEHKFKAWRDAWNERKRAIEEGVPYVVDESMSSDERL